MSHSQYSSCHLNSWKSTICISSGLSISKHQYRIRHSRGSLLSLKDKSESGGRYEEALDQYIGLTVMKREKREDWLGPTFECSIVPRKSWPGQGQT